MTIELRDAHNEVVRAEAQRLNRGARQRLQSDLLLPPRAAGDYTVVARFQDQSYSLTSLRVSPRFRPSVVESIQHPVNYLLGILFACAAITCRVPPSTPAKRWP
jgi:hypothetical protein